MAIQPRWPCLSGRTGQLQAWSDEAIAIAAPRTRRYTDADLSLCRLVRKACLALEIIELPAIEFVDALATAVGLLSAPMQRRRY